MVGFRVDDWFALRYKTHVAGVDPNDASRQPPTPGLSAMCREFREADTSLISGEAKTSPFSSHISLKNSFEGRAGRLLLLAAPNMDSYGVEPSILPPALTVELSNSIFDCVSAFHAAALQSHSVA